MKTPTSSKMIIPAVLLIGVLASCKNDEATSEVPIPDSSERSNNPTSSRTETEILGSLRHAIDRQNHDEIEGAKAGVASLSDAALARLRKQYALTLDNHADREIYIALIKELAKRDPDAALALYEGTDANDSEQFFYQVAEIIAKNNPDKLKDWLLGKGFEGDLKNRRLFIRDGISVFAKAQDAEYALKFSEQAELGPDERDQLSYLVFRRPTDLSPEESTRLAREYLTGRQLQTAIFWIGEMVFATDRMMGLKVGEELESPIEQSHFFAYRYRSWLQEDPEGALRHLEKVDPNRLEGIIRSDTGHFTDSKGNIVELLAKLKPDLLEKTLGAMAVTSSNESVFQVGIVNLSQEQPQRALALIETMPDGKLKSNLYGLHFDQRLTKDPQAAFKDFAELPEGKVRIRAL